MHLLNYIVFMNEFIFFSDPHETEGSTILIQPEVECVLRLGQFVLQMLQGQIWPQSSYPANKYTQNTGKVE